MMTFPQVPFTLGLQMTTHASDAPHAMRLPAIQNALAAAMVGGLGVRPRSSQSWGLLPPIASHPSKVLGQYAPSAILYACRGVPDCTIHHHHRCKLEAVIKSEGLKVAGPATLLQYYPPFAPGFIRLNEVVVPIESPSVKPGPAS
jgi:hypothetical protein